MEYKYNSIYLEFCETAKKYSKKIAVTDGKKRISFYKLKNYADIVANYLIDYGVKKGDRVGIFLPKCWEYIVVILAVSKIGAVSVPINNKIKSKNLSHILEDAQIKLFFAHDSLIDIVKGSIATINYGQVVWVGKEVKGTRFENILSLKPLKKDFSVYLKDLAMICYTSGTSGKTKGAMLSNKNLLFAINSAKKFFNIKSKDRVFLILEMFHNYTLSTGILSPLLSGASIYIYQKDYKKSIFDTILRSKATIFLGIPEIYHSLYKVELPLKFKLFNKIRIFISGAAPLHIDIIKGLEEKFKKAYVVEGYGLTEATGAVTVNSIENRKIGSVGKALSEVEIKIVSNSNRVCKANEVGEILVKSEGIMQGYLNQEELTKEHIKDGWLYTKDLGYLDKDGFLFLKGRKSELIIHKGVNVYPVEIESVLDRFNGVKKSAVIGYKDSKGIEKILAFIELEGGEISIEKLDLYARGFLSEYKIPHKYIVIDELPRSTTGKILKRELENYAIINVNI